MEEYAAFNAAPGSEAQFDDEISPAKQSKVLDYLNQQTIIYGDA